MLNKSAFNSSLKTIGAGTPVLLLFALVTLSACVTTTPPPPPEEAVAIAFTEGVPGGVIVGTLDVKAKVTAIDKAARNVTLMGPDGEEYTTEVGPNAVNFDQVMVGDMLNVTLTRELVVYLDDAGLSGPDGAAGVIAGAPKGDKPAGLVVDAIQATATITEIDTINRTATVQFEDGNFQTLPVRDDIDMSLRKVGEKVVFQSTELIEITVKTPEAQTK